MKTRSKSEIALMSASLEARNKLRLASFDLCQLGGLIQQDEEALRLARKVYQQLSAALEGLRHGLKVRPH